MKKYFILCLIPFLIIYSCTEDFLNNTRLGFEVNIIDENNVALAGIDVNLFFIDGNPSSGSRGIIGSAETNNEGIARLISLSPGEVNDEFFIIINSEEPNLFGSASVINENFGRVTYSFLGEDLTSNTINVPLTILNRASVLNLEINNITNSLNRVNFSLELIAENQFISLNEGESRTTSTIARDLQLEDLPFSINASTLINTTAIFRYELLDTNENIVEMETIEIPINETTVNYVFEY